MGRVSENKYTNVLRAPHHVALDITNKCNLRCLHCYNSSGENEVMHDELTSDELFVFAKEMADMSLYSMCFCGGETLLRSKDILRCLPILRDGNVAASLVTNGLLLTESLLRDLEDSGLKSIQFSLDGIGSAHDRLRGHEGAFEIVEEAVATVLNHSDLHLAIAFTPTSFNTEQFPDVISLLDEIFTKSNRPKRTPGDFIELRVQPLMVLGRARKNTFIRPDYSQYRTLIHAIQEDDFLRKHPNVRPQWGDPVDHLIRFSDNRYLLDQVSVHANGDIVVSPYIPLVVGNIRNHPLEDYWNNGLSSILSTKLVQDLCNHMWTIDDMERMSDTICDIDMGGDLHVDLIDDTADELLNSSLKEMLG